MTLLSCVFCIALLTRVLLCCISHNDDPWCLCCCEPLAVLYNLVRLVGLLLSSLLSSCFGLAIDGIVFLCCVVNCCAALCYVVLQDAHCCAATHASLYLTCILLCCDECVVELRGWPRHLLGRAVTLVSLSVSLLLLRHQCCWVKSLLSCVICFAQLWRVCCCIVICVLLISL